MVVVVAAVAAFNINISMNDGHDLSTITLANIEALASGESGTGICYNSIQTLAGSKILYCGTCTYIDNSTNSPGSSTGICL